MSDCVCHGPRVCRECRKSIKIRFHMPDGQAQKERDAQMASGATDWSWAAIAWLYEHDAELVEDLDR
jgi:hypothetical protein